MTTNASNPVQVERARAAVIEMFGGTIRALDPIGSEVSGIDLSAADTLPPELVDVLEREMAERGFLVFKNARSLEPEDFLRASCLWGGRELHSTHGVHPQTPGGNPHIFRLSNDPRHGIPDVGPQWHNDGSFLPATFSHSGYHIIRPAENGGGTHFAHQGRAFAALPEDRRERWQRLSSVNSASGVVHPVVHVHPVSGQRCIWLHLGMTGAVIEKLPDRDAFRLLHADELAQLCREYNDILDAGLTNGYAMAFEYAENDCVFIDNLAVAHRAAPEAHMPVERQGLRIMHRSTVKGVKDLAPGFDLPQHVGIDGPNPIGEGVWHAGGVGFRWQDGIPMRN
ncbi:TauD/TfdA dioxygenase family protein [Jannaschia seohaensis]|uniref:Taurine dioxygenase n=1 Tax=Jannaschia seohaensis TaxID=475081 RepID=A0A2Y9BY50_9RHOB|nr:TauD/TfdA family dioxygenase [Jannaschia seohaensis]PWJ21396.1 taurine dioxygenase [Jannaschia seohaensis]SSA42002.1 taurine dioxygenase [Jannaschia seohaensis]